MTKNNAKMLANWGIAMNLIDDERNAMRLRLLATVCTAALIGFVPAVQAQSANGPELWIELGGQFDQLTAKQEDWSPSFSGPADPLSGSFSHIDRLPRSGYEANAGLSFRPEDSEWIVSAKIRYGRSNHRASGQAHQSYETRYHHRIYHYENNYNATATAVESHALLDFTVGKDVGLGLVNSTLRAGLRIAQLHSRSQTHVSSFFFLTTYGHANSDSRSDIFRSFNGVGPMLSWDGTAPVVGHAESGRLTFDWGLDAALLFGRQKAAASENGFEQQQYYKRFPTYAVVRYTQSINVDHTRRKSVIVPDLGGFVGLSYRAPNAKISIGYRADTFFNVIDGGIATAKSEDRSFYGPFASISIGVSPSDF